MSLLQCQIWAGLQLFLSPSPKPLSGWRSEPRFSPRIALPACRDQDPLLSIKAVLDKSLKAADLRKCLAIASSLSRLLTQKDTSGNFLISLKTPDCLHSALSRESAYLYFVHLSDLFSFVSNKSGSHLCTKKKSLIKEESD